MGPLPSFLPSEGSCFLEGERNSQCADLSSVSFSSWIHLRGPPSGQAAAVTPLIGGEEARCGFSAAAPLWRRFELPADFIMDQFSAVVGCFHSVSGGELQQPSPFFPPALSFFVCELCQTAATSLPLQKQQLDLILWV